MQIRTRLTLQFVLIFALLICFASILIYYFSSSYRSEEFYTRLESKAKVISRLLIQEEGIDAAILNKIEENNPTNLTEESIRIYNRQSNLIFSNRMNVTNIDTGVFFKKLRQEKLFMMEKNKRQHLGFLFESDNDNYIVLASAYDKYGYNKLNNLRNVLYVVIGISLIMVFVAGRIYSGRALNPINLIIDEVNNIGAVNLDSRLSESSNPDELGRLALTFNQLLERLELAFVTQKNFIANASHELRTPLTAIHGQLDVLLLQERSKSEYIETMKSVLEEIKNLEQISNNLLLLAQTSSDNPSFQIYPIRADEVIWSAIKNLKSSNPDYEVAIQMDNDLTEELLTVSGNEQLLKTAFVNLMDNACKYSENQKVEIHLASKEQKLIIEFLDKGIGVSEDDIPHLFEPFFRSKNVGFLQGHGIGLSLVDRIVRLHNGDILFWSKPNEGTKVSLILPLILKKIN